MTKRGSDDLQTGGLAKKAHSDDAEDELIVYEPTIVPPELKSRMNSLVEVLLPPRYLVADHKQVKVRQLWGTDTYTDDSDLVAVLVHTGHVKLKATAPKMPLLVSLRVCPTATSYSGSDRNGLKSREWAKTHSGVSYKVERCLQHTAGVPPPEVSLLRPSTTSRQIPGSLVSVPPGPGQSFAIPATSCLVVFSLSSEPWLKYSLALVADQGTDKERWTSTRLRREALYLESTTERLELAVAPSADGEYDTYTLSRVETPHEMDARAVEAAGVPLPASKTEVVEEALDWEELVWGPSYVRVRGHEYTVLRCLYVPYSKAA